MSDISFYPETLNKISGKGELQALHISVYNKIVLNAGRKAE